MPRRFAPDRPVFPDQQAFLAGTTPSEGALGRARSWGVYALAVLGLLVLQVALAEAGGRVAQRVQTSDGWWVHVTVGHVTTTVLTLVVLWPLAR